MENILAEWKNSTSSVSDHEATFTSDHPLQEGLVAAAEHGQGDIVKHLLSNGFRVSPGYSTERFSYPAIELIEFSVRCHTRRVKVAIDRGLSGDDRFRLEY